MAVLDVAIPTGYWIQQQKLDTYVLSNRVRNLRRARYLERKIVFYFDYVSAKVEVLAKCCKYSQMFCLLAYSWIRRTFASTSP